MRRGSGKYSSRYVLSVRRGFRKYQFRFGKFLSWFVLSVRRAEDLGNFLESFVFSAPQVTSLVRSQNVVLGAEM